MSTKHFLENSSCRIYLNIVKSIYVQCDAICERQGEYSNYLFRAVCSKCYYREK